MEGSSNELKKGSWTAEEDRLLRQCIDKFGEGKWHLVPLRARLNRCRKSCRLRWVNYLEPSKKGGKLSFDEVDLLMRLHKLLGNRWSLIAGRLPGRTANDVKNYWNTHLGKTRMRKKNMTSSPSTEDQRVEVLKPQPRYLSVNSSCSHLNGLPKNDVISSCFGLNNVNSCENNIASDVIPSCLGLNNVNSCENNITPDNCEPLYNLTDEDNMWLESLLIEKTQEENVQIGPEGTATNKETTLIFDDFEQLWNSLDGQTMEPK